MLSNRENALLAYRHKTPERLPCMLTDIAFMQACPEIERYMFDSVGTDFFGVEWTYVPQQGAPMPTPGKILLEDISDWREKVTIPDLDLIDWETISHRDLHSDSVGLLMGKGPIPFADGHSLKDEDKLILCMSVNGMFERLHACMGMEGALCALLEDPEECYNFFGAVADHKIRHIEKLAKYYQPDIYNAQDDYGASDRMLLSPTTWRELIKPHLKRIIDACHANGMLYQHHSCGYFEPIFPDLIELGIDAMDVWQVGNRNVRQLKDQYQHICTFSGGFDSQGVTGRTDVTAPEIVNEYHRVVDLLAPGGSFVVYVPSLRRDLMPVFFREHQTYGVNFYQTGKQ